MVVVYPVDMPQVFLQILIMALLEIVKYIHHINLIYIHKVQALINLWDIMRAIIMVK